jgi:DNA-binding beta-propeller fold protein YncE
MTITRLLGSVALVTAGGLSLAAPVPKGGLPPAGVFVLDDCDPDYKGKAAYEDNLSAIGPSGKLVFRTSGLNGCQSIGSAHLIANDPARRRVWLLELVGHRVRQFDHSGRETVSVTDVKASAAAVDPATGHLWVLTTQGTIGSGRTVVLDGRGKQVAAHDANGYDIAYDPKGKAFWVAGPNLTKMSAKDGTVLSTRPISTWCASSLDVHPATGRVWVAVREHSQVPGSENKLLQFDNDGGLLRTVELGTAVPFKVSVDPATGAVWATILRKSVRRYSADGKLEAEHKLSALAAEAVPGGAWVVTPEETVQLTGNGKIEVRVKHRSTTSQAWITKF